jgi:hypothetical protein
MNFAAPILDMIGAACKAANAILSFVPALAWALLLAVAMAYGGLMHHERDSAVKAKNEAIGQKQQIEAQLAQQKKDAKAKLDALTAERDAAQKQVDDFTKAQEIESEKRRHDGATASASLARDAARNGGRLRDPAGCGSGGAGPQGQTAAPTADRARDATEASGVLSEPLSRLLQWVADDAQRQADAYAGARADAMMCRAAMGASP